MRQAMIEVAGVPEPADGGERPARTDAAVGVGRPEGDAEDEEGRDDEEEGEPDERGQGDEPFPERGDACSSYLPLRGSPTFWGGTASRASSAFRKWSSMKPSSACHQIQTSSFQRRGFSSRKYRECGRRTWIR